MARADCGKGLLEAPGAFRKYHDDERRQRLAQDLGYLATVLLKHHLNICQSIDKIKLIYKEACLFSSLKEESYLRYSLKSFFLLDMRQRHDLQMNISDDKSSSDVLC